MSDPNSRNNNSREAYQSQHSDFILNGLQILKSNKILCDITLIAENVKFQVHKVIMASCSDYFRSMFTSGMKESTQSEIELKGVSAKGLEKVIEIVYTSCTNFESHNELFEVISAATHLQCLIVVEYCERNFLSQLTCYNFNHFIQMAKLYRLENALRQIDLFICNNLTQIINISSNQNDGSNLKDSGIICLSFEQLLKCLRHDDLRIREIDLFFLTWKWIKHTLFNCQNIQNSVKRSRISTNLINKNLNYLNQKITTETNLKRKIDIIRCLMRQIRFALISPSDLVNKVQLNKLIKNDKCLRKIVLNALNYHLMPFSQPNIFKIENRTKEINHYNININIRSSIESILLIGGREIYPNPSLHDTCLLLSEYSETLNSSKIFNNSNDNYSNKSITNRINITTLPNVLSHMQCVVLESNFLYVIGGCISQCAHGESAVSTTYRYDPRLNTWLNVCPMLDKRAYFYACSLNVISNGAQISTESLTSKQFIFSIGGKNRDGALFTVEKYDLEKNQWIYAQQLPSTYYAHAGCVLENKAYISGGYSHGHFTADLHVYLPNSNQWEELRPMNSSRGWHCMCVANNHLFVFGGCYLNSNTNPTNIIPTQTHQLQQQQQMAQPVTVTEYYSPLNDQWTIVKPMINLHKEASCFKLNNSIYIVGGYNIQDKTGQKFISKYDYLSDTWQTIGQLLNGMTGFCCCQISLPWYVFEENEQQQNSYNQLPTFFASPIVSKNRSKNLRNKIINEDIGENENFTCNEESENETEYEYEYDEESDEESDEENDDDNYKLKQT